MTFGFYEQKTYCFSGELPADFFDKLPENISRDALWQYECEKTADGCCLTPTFKDVPYRNSFVPEITISTSCADGETAVHFCGRLVPGIRIFMGIWFGFLAFLEVLLLCALVVGQTEWYAPLIPLGMAAFGYLLCKIGMKLPYRAVMRAIRGALGQRT